MQSLAQPQSQRERPSLSRSPQAVQGAPVQEERQAPQSEVPQAEPADSSAFMGSAWKMGVLTDSVIRFKKPKRKKARAIAPLTKKPEEQNETLKEQRGLCCMVIPSCMVLGLINVSLNTFQRGSGLKTIENIVLSSSFDISSCLVVVFIAYYGRKGNILKWITVSSFLVGFGSLLFAFPHFHGESYQLDIEIEDICKEKKISDDCKKSFPIYAKYVTFIMLGLTVQGIAGMPLYILTVPFLDDSIDEHSIGTYLGMLEASLTVGYALGYAIAAPLVTNPKRSTSNITVDGGDNNEHWLHTWWIRFVFVTVMAWSTLIAFLCFPRHIKGTGKITTSERQEKHQPFDKKYKDQEFGTSISGLFASIWILVKTPMFVFLALTRASDFLLIIGASAFLPKYIENQFILTPSQATTLSGLVLIPGGAFGQLLGGVIASKLQMYCKGRMSFTMVTSAISLVLVTLTMFVRCEPMPFAGITEDYNGTGQLGNLTAPCNSHCKCSSSFYFAVCGRDDIGYFSPCFAGCNKSKTFNNEKTYFSCSCIDEGIAISDEQGDFIDANAGACVSSCYKLPMFIVFVFSTILFACFSVIPNMLTILRTVPDKQRSLALGLTYMIVRTFGAIPGPIVFNKLVENSCTFRDSGHCGNTESCWIYNVKKMAYLYLGMCFFCKLSTIFFTSIAFALRKYLLKENSVILTTTFLERED
ncbi:PREDICTED: solute carrier organic anion transporter family member 6A1 [Myotis brandtii]|uniref:solute carrier organic anion transporter family member 6A1 n=1 Tax=Myotis brandtii TaxID=109478 RepID=UPI0003BBEE0E|nr:PREDICTED: solute carrier organic anion transporter family member 6A1 [Myotis brandtii]